MESGISHCEISFFEVIRFNNHGLRLGHLPAKLGTYRVPSVPNAEILGTMVCATSQKCCDLSLYQGVPNRLHLTSSCMVLRSDDLLQSLTSIIVILNVVERKLERVQFRRHG